MKLALKEARKAFKKDEVPVGCVAVRDGKLIARAHNQRENLKDPLAHAEILCLKKAAKKLGGWYMNRVTIYSTLEPCLMCAGAMIHARVKNLVFAAHDKKARSSRILKKFAIKVKSGILQSEAEELIKRFFKGLRKLKSS